MGLQSTINFYNFYQKYNWQPSDFAAFQSALASYVGLFSGGQAQILNGLLPSPGGGLAVNISAGVCVNNAGYPMYVPAQQSVTIASPSGNPAISLVVCRPLQTNNTNIPQPTNPSNNVPLLQTQGYQLVVINGTPAATPVAPSTQSGDVIVAEMYLAASITTITSANFRYDLVAQGIKKRHRVLTINHSMSPYALTGNEDIVEFDCSAGAVSAGMAPASANPGMETSFVRIDSATGNACAVSAAEMISGQSIVTLDDEWATARIYSNSQSYRIY